MGATISTKSEWEEILKRATAGDAEAQGEVAYYFDFGIENVLTEDPKQAFDWYRKAYENGNAEAGIRLADFYSEGTHCEKDLDLAEQLYRKAIEGGSSIAASNLATDYRDKGDYETMFGLHLQAQVLDNNITLEVAFCYYYGIGTEQNQQKAFEMFELISESKGSVTNCGYAVDEANYYLGKAYLEGIVVAKSIEKARHYLRLANLDDDHRSANRLLYIIGNKG